jgi:uncharacterized membrane protein
MEIVYKLVYALHVSGGALAFFMAPAALASVKGGTWHRRWGKVYFWAMALVAFTGTVLGLTGRIANSFFIFLGIFTFYNAFSAYRVLYRKRPQHGQGPKMLDWAGALVGLLNGVAFVAMGYIKPDRVWAQMGTVAMVFGGICIVLAAQDIKTFLFPPEDKNFWWYSHMGGMLGSYIAALTAFLVIAGRPYMQALPAWLPWLLPTGVGVPTIIIWTGYYRRRFNAKAVA